MKNKVMILSIITLAMPESCYAYLDPSSGSIVVQMFIALVVGFLFTLKLFWKKIVGLIQKGLLGKNKIEDTDIK